MPHPEAAPHIRLDLYQEHSSAVTATITGTPTRTLHALLTLHGFEPLDEQTMVLARIDSEEPHYAEQAARALRAENLTVDITPELREEIDTEWTWANYPMPWCSREEVREVSNDAQKIYDDIRHGRLIIHAHAHDGWTTVAVGTYLHGPSIHLHGENHLRTESTRYDNPAEAITEFDRLYGDAVRPGPAPATSIELEAERTSASLPGTADPSTAPATTGLVVDAHAAVASNHEALLNEFLDSHGEWEKWRTWSDDTTHAIHEDQTLRIEHVHEADAHETVWTVAAYETPVSDRMWVLTTTSATPAPMLRGLLRHLAEADISDTVLGSPVGEKTVTASTRPLAEAGWNHTVDGQGIRWTSPTGDAGVKFNAFAAQRPTQNRATWTIWGGPDPDHPAWTLTASPYTPSLLLADLAEVLAYETGAHQGPAARTRRLTNSTATSPSLPAAANAGHQPSRTR
ncbi:DUF317 domain-containing protein [Streptomyces sp. CB02460]|uniref:DUF317 domain-containing protein n=1 Tax=Streptomyces sp. CB02460 TaxID=1703941 RepID=UPI00093D75E2|nr:DUF317 domain-containing protein [Streptomyces sp. CB02460]OKJ72210.1 hypothetical protein AMK30_20785 [Streptomyces sp. CB02460]